MVDVGHLYLGSLDRMQIGNANRQFISASPFATRKDVAVLHFISDEQ